jgi:hypothetical protein
VPIDLEDGITVTFGGADTDTLRAGDYWVFAARTTDSSVDQIQFSPPLGVLHHYTRLAVISSGITPSVLEDCRTFWTAYPPARREGV